MSAPPDATAALLGRVRHRLIAREVARAAALAAIVVAVLLVAGGWFRVDAGARWGAAGLFATALAARRIAVGRRRCTTRRAAYVIEGQERSLRNVIITAEELLVAPESAVPYMRARVIREAGAAAAHIEASSVVPLRHDLVFAATAVAVVVLAASIPAPIGRTAQATVGGGHITTPADGLEVEITPPAYTRRPSRRDHNPQAITALAGSTIAIRVPGVASPAVRLNGGAIRPDADAAVRMTVIESGAVMVDGGSVHALLPLTVIPDAAPDVHVTVPARDLRVSSSQAAVPVHATATDDLALRALELRYTVVSGGGEQFSFKEGTLPAATTRGSEQSWGVDATISLPALHLAPGDALVYRAVAADARPGAGGESSSDTYFIEIAGPGDVPLDGVDMPPDRERYALSEAMIVLKLQQLIAHQASLPRVDVEEQAANIAAEQRAVRANFVFMLGGEVEDEVVEAEASHEIQEGRLANQARREIVAATILMEKVERSLAAVSPRAALPPAQDAVRTLQRAFGHSRYLLRALPARIRIDPARRLTGDTAPARDWRRDVTAPVSEPRTAMARAALGALLDVSRSLDKTAGSRLTAVAEQVLAVEPGAPDLQQVSRHLMAARDATERGDLDQARAALREAAPPLVRRAARGQLDARPTDADALRLGGIAAIAGGRR